MNRSLSFSVLVTSALLVVPSALFAQGFVPLVPDIPFMQGDASWFGGDPGTGFTRLLQALIGISVGLAAVLAVVMLAVGGFKYMTTDSAFRLGDAKEQITSAIIGLLIVLTAVLILNTINPQLTSLQVFRGMTGDRAYKPSKPLVPGGGSTGGGGATGTIGSPSAGSSGTPQPPAGSTPGTPAPGPGPGATPGTPSTGPGTTPTTPPGPPATPIFAPGGTTALP